MATGESWPPGHSKTTSTSIPPGKAPHFQRTASSPAGLVPPPGTWHPGRLLPAGRGHSCKRPTVTR